MNLRTFILSRIRRPFLYFGPNEGRIVYDVVVTAGAALASLLFHKLFFNVSVSASIVFLLPALTFGVFALAGIYSRLRVSSGQVKAIAISISVVAATLLALPLIEPVSAVVLASIISLPILVLARVLLNIQYSKNRNFLISTVRQRGKVLVLGGAGYIGSHVVAQLLDAGESVRVLDRLMYGDESLREFNSNKNFEFVPGDITDIAKLTEAMRGASAVVHLAGLVGDPACAVDPKFTRHTNIIATRMAKEIARAMGIYRFVFSSSCSVYGTSDKEVKESDSLSPVSLYAQTKIDSETELLRQSYDDFFVTVLRFATVFGHSRRPRFDLVANLFTAQAVNDGLITVVGPTQWRPFIHCRDLARAIVLVLKADPRLVQGQIFNVGDKRLNMTIGQLADSVKTEVSKKRRVELSIRDDALDRRNYSVSFEKIRSLLGFEAETLMSAGIAEMVAGFENGAYAHYKNERYSNLAVTRKVVEVFHDPASTSSLYAPLDASNS